MTDFQSAITRLRQADDQHPDFWNTLQDRDADPQMGLDVVAVARAYVRHMTPAHSALYDIRALCDFEYRKIANASSVLAHIAHKASKGLGE